MYAPATPEYLDAVKGAFAVETQDSGAGGAASNTSAPSFFGERICYAINQILPQHYPNDTSFAGKDEDSAAADGFKFPQVRDSLAHCGTPRSGAQAPSPKRAGAPAQVALTRMPRACAVESCIWGAGGEGGGACGWAYARGSAHVAMPVPCKTAI
jgi:hypothetical protein